MAYNQNTGKDTVKSYTDNINTDGFQMYGTNGTLVAGGWNDMITINIHPLKPESERTEKSRYDYSKKIFCSITKEEALLIADIIQKDIIPAIEKGEEKSVYMPIQKVNIIAVGTGVKETGSVKPFIGIFRKVNEKCIPEEYTTLEFTPTRVLSAYDPKTGEYTSTEVKVTPIHAFGVFLSSFAQGLMKGTVHADKYENRFRDARAYEHSKAVESRLGIENTRTNYVQRSNTPAQDPWDTGSQPAQSHSSADAEQTPVTSISGLESLQGLA